MSGTAGPLLTVRGAVQTFYARSRVRGMPGEEIRALDGVDLDVVPGERLGIVGESGSGKSTLARAVVGLRALDAGRVEFEGTDVGALHGAELRRLRARLQLVLQDPLASLDPRMTVRRLVREGLDVHATTPPAERAALVEETLAQCGIGPALLERTPAALSGGQRQRVALARSLVLRPTLVLLDEPVSALDVSVQAQILNLLLDLQELHGLTYLFIVHDLAVARWFCDRIVVMHRGRIVEQGPSEQLFADPREPYTRELLAASALHAVVRRRPGSAQAAGSSSATASTTTGPPNGSAATPNAERA